jgi:uncharacterized membrane protein YqhA
MQVGGGNPRTFGERPVLNRLMLLRYMSLIAVVASFFGAALMFVIGAVKTYNAYATYVTGDVGAQGVSETNIAMAYVIQSFDAFLIALALLIFAYGVYNLFVSRAEPGTDSGEPWLQVSSFAQLKKLLAELVIIILFVRFLEIALFSIEGLSWEALVLPVGILLLALALKFLDLKKDA